MDVKDKVNNVESNPLTDFDLPEQHIKVYQSITYLVKRWKGVSCTLEVINPKCKL